MLLGFSWFDIVILALTFLIAIRGIINGFIRELLGLIGIVGGVIIASRYFSVLGEFINTHIYHISNEDLLKFVAFISMVIIIWVFCLFLAAIFSNLIKLSGLGFLNRLLGFLFSGAKIFLIFSILVFCINKISFLSASIKPMVQDSKVFASLEKFGAFIMNDERVQDGIEAVEKGISEVNQSIQ